MKTCKLSEIDARRIVVLAVPTADGGVLEIRNMPHLRDRFEAALAEHADALVTRVSETEWDSATVSLVTLRDKRQLALDVPAEFFDFCEEHGVLPAQVFAGLVGDLCNISTAELTFNSHGSDERMLARQWFDRVTWN